MSRTRPYPLYLYAYTAWCGRIGEKVSDIVIGEVESKQRGHAVSAIRKQVRALTARYPREVKLSAGQFSRMSKVRT